MATKFTIPITKDVDTALKEIRDGIIGGGGEFDGDRDGGTFSGKSPLGSIAGNYTLLNESEIEITITKKPMMLSKIAIKSAIKDYLA